LPRKNTEFVKCSVSTIRPANYGDLRENFFLVGSIKLRRFCSWIFDGLKWHSYIWGHSLWIIKKAPNVTFV